jgi:hypothetical protein
LARDVTEYLRGKAGSSTINLGKLDFEAKKYAIRSGFSAYFAEKPLEEGCGSRILLQ